MGGGVMRELSHRQKVCPFCGLTLAKDSEVGFQLLIDLFGLAIGLGIIGSEKGNVVFEKLGQLLCKGRGKLWTPVRNHSVV